MDKNVNNVVSQILGQEAQECAQLLSDNFKYFNLDIQEEILSILLSSDLLLKSVMQRLLVQPLDPTDTFMVSLSRMRDDGDIEHLVRALNWQHLDICNLKEQLVGYERALKVTDKLRQDTARLRDSVNKLRDRNGELMRTIHKLRSNGKKSSKN